MAPFEALYGHNCHTPLYWIKLSERRVVGPNLNQEVEEKVKLIKDMLKSSFDRLPFDLEPIHDVFYVPMLRRYRWDPFHVVLINEVEVQEDISYEEELVKILASDVKVLRNNSISLVKVLWRNHNIEEVTWEIEESMRAPSM
ncbi:uncharacterized protein LOC120120731 [Hibiscus syriacus]|uniref:uncharacterized protein LOC120120731 n=1 Tax=Hibiscus syriacus TaxID=106335 RepID=UPI001924F87F|nr:uncharacterized protein LOC120120731 [Hibiscus syriacus]